MFVAWLLFRVMCLSHWRGYLYPKYESVFAITLLAFRRITSSYTLQNEYDLMTTQQFQSKNKIKTRSIFAHS